MLFGKGVLVLDQDGNWLPRPGAELHPADAVRMVVAMTEPNGQHLAALISQHGWEAHTAEDPDRDAAIEAQRGSRERILTWLRSGQLVAWTERGDVSTDAWIRKIDPESPSTWWPLDAPNHGCWRVAKFQLEAMLAKLLPPSVEGEAKPKVIPDADLRTIANTLAREMGPSGKVSFRDRLKKTIEDAGYSVTRNRAEGEAERLEMKKKQGRPAKRDGKIPE